MKAKELFPGIFSRHARAYRDRAMTSEGTPAAAARSVVLERAAARPGERVLDLACGPGTLTLQLAEAVGPAGRVVAVDLADGMLELLRERAPANVDVRRMDIEELDFEDGAFDAVTCGHGLQFVPDLARTLREAFRVLRPGGRYAASVPDGGASTRDGVFAEALAPPLPPAPSVADRDQTIEIIRDPERLAASLVCAGFTDVRVTRHEETASFPDAAAVVERTLSWWDCASRMEKLEAQEQQRVREQYRAKLDSAITEWPVVVTSYSHVASAVRPA